MTEFNKKKHWETIYGTKTQLEVSWYEPIPTTSIKFIEECSLDSNDPIIDVGGGDSLLVDYLVNQHFNAVHVLDISANALNRAKTRLGAESSKVTWIESDILAFDTQESFSLWHDRAVFHFLTDPNEILCYVDLAAKLIRPGGCLVIGTFSTDGPLKCSGIEIKQYDQDSLINTFGTDFHAERFELVQHTTPFDTTQNFIFGKFVRK